jgi:hypothetical protein
MKRKPTSDALCPAWKTAARAGTAVADEQAKKSQALGGLAKMRYRWCKF